MKVYKFKCKDCGSTRYKKHENIYKCQYCGYTEEVFLSDNNIDDAQNSEKNKISLSEQMKEHREKFEIERKKFTRKFLACMLCYFVGMMGIHRIVERKIFTGVIYLCTFGGFFIGWIYDILKYSFELRDISVGLNIIQYEFYEKFGEGIDNYE